MAFDVFEGKEQSVWIVEAINEEGEREMLWPNSMEAEHKGEPKNTQNG
jgi:hypothetical protein